MNKVTINKQTRPRKGKISSFPGGTLVEWKGDHSTEPCIFVVSSAAYTRPDCERVGALNLSTGLYLTPDVEVTELAPGNIVTLEVLGG